MGTDVRVGFKFLIQKAHLPPSHNISLLPHAFILLIPAIPPCIVLTNYQRCTVGSHPMILHFNKILKKPQPSTGISYFSIMQSPYSKDSKLSKLYYCSAHDVIFLRNSNH